MSAYIPQAKAWGFGGGIGKEKMRLHIAKERFADLKEESTRDAVIQLRGVHGFTLNDCAAILDRPLHEIEFAWDIAKQNAR